MKKTWKSNHYSGSCEPCFTKQKKHNPAANKIVSDLPEQHKKKNSLICLCGQILAQGKHLCLLLKLHKAGKNLFYPGHAFKLLRVCVSLTV